nr:retrovirus-related Pol polyprotein from transposon TNT 1-94 [Tanacetum cinerariifolium]
MKKRKDKRTEILKEVSVTENIIVDGMQRNLIPPPRVMPIEGPVINELESGIFFMNRNMYIAFQREKVNATFLNSLPRKWLSMNQTQRANNSIKNDSLSTLYRKYNYKERLIDQIYELEIQRFTIQASSSKALISNHQFQDSDSDVKEDQWTSNEFMADLNAEYHESALLANQKRFYKRSGRVGSARKPLEKSKETCFACGRLGHFKNNVPQTKLPYHLIHHQTIPSTNPNHTHHPLTKRLLRTLGKKEKEKSKKGLIAKSFDWDDEFVSSDDEGSTKIRSFMEIAEDEPSVGKANARSGQWVDITMKRNLFHLFLPYCTSKNLISLSDLTLNMADLTLDTTVPKKTRPSVKVSHAYVVKKKTKKSPIVPKPCFNKKANSSTEQLLLTLMEEVKGLKRKIKILLGTPPTSSQPSSSKVTKKKTWFGPCKYCGFKNHLFDDCYSKPKCSTCRSTNHLTKEHFEHATIKNTLTKLKAQAPLKLSPKKALMIPKPLKECKYYGINDHHSDHYEFYPGCKVCGSIAHKPSDYLKKHPNSRRPRIANRERSPNISYFCMFGCPVHIHNHKDHLGKFDEKAYDGFFLGYSLVAKAFRVFKIKRQEMEETVHVTFSEDDEAISQSSTEDPPVFTETDDRLALNEPNQTELVDHLEPVEPQNNVIMKSISDVQPLPTIPPSAEVILQTHVPRDRWLREKHIELVNIIGEPLASITTRSRIRDLDVAFTSKCIYVNFLTEMEPKKFIEALEEEGWIIAMQEELNQFKRNKVWTLVPKPHGKTIIQTKWVWKNKMDENGIVIKNKARLVSQGYNQHEGIDYEETFAHVVTLESIRIFLAYAAYMGFMVYQIDSLEIDTGNIIFLDLVHKLQNGKKNRETNIFYTSCFFSKPLALEAPLTSHMLKVAKLYEEPKQSLIPLSEEVNANETADKSLSRASVQPVTQPKAPTDLKTKKKIIPPSFKPKSQNKVRVILPTKQVAETQHPKVTVATANATKSLVASKLAEKQGNQPSVAEAEKVTVLVILLTSVTLRGLGMIDFRGVGDGINDGGIKNFSFLVGGSSSVSFFEVSSSELFSFEVSRTKAFSSLTGGACLAFGDSGLFFSHLSPSALAFLKTFSALRRETIS